MPLSSASRSELTRKLTETGASPIAVEEMLSCLPSGDYDAPITRTQLADELRVAAAENAKRLDERLTTTNDRISKINDERRQEMFSGRAYFLDVALPMILVVIAFIAILALCVASRAEKATDRSPEERGTPVRRTAHLEQRDGHLVAVSNTSITDDDVLGLVDAGRR